MSVYTKLNEAREEFHAAKIKKTGFNSFAKYEYFELSDFIVPALAIFKKFGLLGYVSFGQEMASLTIVNAEKPEERIVIESPMSTCEMKGLHAVQQLGAVQSYLRRYLWVSALEIVEHDALDATTGKDVKSKSALAGIGDDIPADWKIYLQDLAKEITNLVASGDIDGAKEKFSSAISENDLDGDYIIFAERHMDSKTRSAISTRK